MSADPLAPAAIVGSLVATAVLLLPASPADRLRRLAAGRSSRRGGPRRKGPRWPAAVRRRRPDEVTDVPAVAAELASLTRGGLAPAAAWAEVDGGVGDDPAGRVLAAAAAAGRRGEPVAGLLLLGGPSGRPARWSGRRSGRWSGRWLGRWFGRRRPVPPAAAAQLAVLSATLDVHERTGAPVADLLDRAAAGLRADADAALARRSALAAPLATARVLVALPPLGLLLGVAVGGDPVQVLVLDPVGRWCGVVGTVCAAAAWGWSRALVRRAVGS